MGRTKKVDISSFVTVDEENQTARCLTCNKTLKHHTGNIKRHCKTIHGYNLEQTSGDLHQGPTPSKKAKKITISLHMDRSEFLKCIGHTVTRLHMPFRYYDDEKCFQKLLQPWNDAFGIKFNSKNIVDHIADMSSKCRQRIKEKVKNKILCLKMDIASRMGRSLMGVNIQYIEGFTVKVNTIGMVQLQSAHTAEYLKSEIMKCLSEFDIDIKQIYSMTTDNGANVIKTSELLQECKEAGVCLNDDVDNFEGFERVIQESMCVVHCAAHTLQLASWDVIKKMKPQIDACCEATKILRTEFRRRGLSPLPVLNNNTRWSSTYEMIRSLHKLRPTIESNSPSNASFDWTFIEEFIPSFKPIADCTKLLQTQNLIMGDFYREWLVCETELEELSPTNIYADMLLSAMQSRKKILLQNDAFLAAIFLDPRFNFKGSLYLNDTQKMAAVKKLLEIHSTLRDFEHSVETLDDNPQPNCQSAESSRYSKLEKKVATTHFLPITEDNVKQKIESLQYVDKLPFEKDALQYYRNISYKDSTLTQIAEVALAVPATQVSLERAFSALPIVFTKLRNKLSARNLENILLIKLNQNIVEEISF